MNIVTTLLTGGQFNANGFFVTPEAVRQAFDCISGSMKAGKPVLVLAQDPDDPLRPSLLDTYAQVMRVWMDGYALKGCIQFMGPMTGAEHFVLQERGKPNICYVTTPIGNVIDDFQELLWVSFGIRNDDLSPCMGEEHVVDYAAPEGDSQRPPHWEEVNQNLAAANAALERRNKELLESNRGLEAELNARRADVEFLRGRLEEEKGLKNAVGQAFDAAKEQHLKEEASLLEKLEKLRGEHYRALGLLRKTRRGALDFIARIDQSELPIFDVPLR